MPASDFYNIGILDQQVVNLFYGWGYNFYRVENQLRADDQLVRAKACSFLGEARAAVVRAEAEFRRTRLPQPSRAKPFPDASVVGEAQSLERLSGAIGSLEGQIRNQPAPESDRIDGVPHPRETAMLFGHAAVAIDVRKEISLFDVLKYQVTGARSVHTTL